MSTGKITFARYEAYEPHGRPVFAAQVTTKNIEAAADWAPSPVSVGDFVILGNNGSRGKVYSELDFGDAYYRETRRGKVA